MSGLALVMTGVLIAHRLQKGGTIMDMKFVKVSVGALASFLWILVGVYLIRNPRKAKENKRVVALVSMLGAVLALLAGVWLS